MSARIALVLGLVTAFLATKVAAQDGGVPPATTDAGPQNGTISADGGVPWATVQSGTTYVPPPPPAWLDTTDQRIEPDNRPPPTAEALAALEEMEAELGRFQQVGRSYRDVVASVVRREYLQQRRGREQWYARQIREETSLQNEARESAIELFERFIAEYPNDPTYTPDAMFRLGELYFERSADQFQTAMENRQAVGDSGEEIEGSDTPDFSPTVLLYQRLVSLFPDYERIDGTYYLIGYCLHEMGEPARARIAWLALVCTNNFPYRPDPPPTPLPPDPPDPEHPSQTLDDPPDPLTIPVEASGPFRDPYEQCQPVRPDARFLSETWFRIGEYHFDDYRDPHALRLAIAAYSRILQNPEDRNYNLALYKVAWAYYRDFNYPEAMRYFGQLVEWSDREEERTGEAGSELRPEAIQYLGITLAYDDWNENQVPDPEEGMPRGISRVQDPNLIPQDRTWTPDVYFQLGQVYYDEARYPEAIEVWQIALERWPMHLRAPEILNQIAQAYAEHQEEERYFETLAQLGRYGLGTEWHRNQMEHPAEQRNAEHLAETALIRTALRYHQHAQRERRQCQGEGPSECPEATRLYTLAAQAYQQYLDAYPNDPQAYELRYNLASAYYWAGSYEQAAAEYSAVRDSNLDDSHMVEAAQRAVESYKRLVEQLERSGQFTVRTDPPEASGDPRRVLPVEMPEPVQRLAAARELFVARISENQDRENLREAYAFNNALLLYAYGYWDYARERLQQIFETRCSGPNAHDSGQQAWRNLRNMAIQLENDDEVERLTQELQTRQCTFSPDLQPGESIDCQDARFAEHPLCREVPETLNALAYRRAIEVYRQAEAAQGDEQRRLYEQAATTLVEAVNNNPGDSQAPIALEWAATALERTSRFESAAGLYQRIIDEVGPRTASSPEEQVRLDAILANAYFRLADNANRFFDFERAIENYSMLADNTDRFQNSQDPTIRERREDALVNSAIILENLRRYDRASAYYRRTAELTTNGETQRTAYYRIAEMAFQQENWRAATTAMQEFISRYRGDGQAGELWVQAHWRLAQIAQEQNRRQADYDRALQDVVTAFNSIGAPRGSIAAEYAANAAFILADRNMASFENFSINPGRPPTMQAYVQTLRSSVENGSRQATALVEGYNPVVQNYGRPTWTVAGLVRQGRTYEILARSIFDAEFTIPADLQSQMRGLPDEDQEGIRVEVEDRIREVLDELTRPVECRAITRYALAARAARTAALRNEYTEIAINRLQAYGDDRIGECITQAMQTQEWPANAPYQAGEFRRAPRGQDIIVAPGAGPPALSE